MIMKLLLLGIIAVLMVIALINGWVIINNYGNFFTPETINQTEFMEDSTIPILVLGAGIIDNETPSTILQLRLDKAIELAQYYSKSPIIMSGDHMDQYYNEVGVMKNYVVAKGIESQRVYLDHAGYSTYDSLYRLKNVLKQDKVVIITQGYHLSRALLLAKGLGIEAVGVPAEESSSTRIERELREILARVKDFFVVYFNSELPKPELNYGFNLQESGDLTNEKEQLEKRIKK